MRKISHIIIHCSDFPYGDVKQIDGWHRDNGWNGIGYHRVILNGHIASDEVIEIYDGLVEHGRDLALNGSHARGHNRNSIGICLIGVDEFTKAQLFSLLFLLREFIEKFDIKIDNILGHNEIKQSGGKTCPNFSVEKIRAFLRDKDFDPAKLPPRDKDFNFV